MRKWGSIVVIVAIAAVAVWYFALREPAPAPQTATAPAPATTPAPATATPPAASTAAAPAAIDAAAVIKARKDNRQAVRGAMGAIKKIIDENGNAAEAAPLATRIAELERQFVTQFPPGTETGDTKALPVIWSDRAGFENASKGAETAALALATAAGTGQIAAVGAGFGALGATCGVCHDTYRAK